MAALDSFDLSFKRLFCLGGGIGYVWEIEWLVFATITLGMGAVVTVFLSDQIVKKILVGGERDVLLVSHHPLAMETSDRGFLPLSETCLEALQKRGISVYELHTPLDMHKKLSTSRALARELGLKKLKRWCQVPGGYAGVHGYLPAPIRFDDLLERVSHVTNVTDPHFIRNCEAVYKMGVLAGGVGVDEITEATALNCDMLVTGRIRSSIAISLIECSHYASEAVVMRKDILELCARLGMACEFVPQDDPWY